MSLGTMKAMFGVVMIRVRGASSSRARKPSRKASGSLRCSITSSPECVLEGAVIGGVVDDQDFTVILAQDRNWEPIQDRRQRGLSVVCHDEDQQPESLGAHPNHCGSQTPVLLALAHKISLKDCETGRSADRGFDPFTAGRLG